MNLRRILVPLVLVGPWVGNAAAQLPIPQRAELLLARELPKLATPRPYRLRVSPPIPRVWPPDGTVYYYGYGSAFDPAVRDGERVAEAWGRVAVTGGVIAAEVERLSPEIKEAGVQAVRPLAAAEARILTGVDRVTKRVLALEAKDQEAATDPEIRAFYCLWARTNQVGAGILSRHPELERWLACSARGRR